MATPIAIPDQEISAIRTKATKGYNQAELIEVGSEEAMVEATDLLGNIKTALKVVTSKEKEITDPMNQAIKKVRELFSPIKSKLTEAEALVKGKMIRYQKMVTEDAAAELAKVEAAVDGGRMTFSEANEAAAEILAPVKTVESKKGSATFRDVQVVEVTDPMLVPREYLAVDMVLVRRAALAGTAIPGVTVRTEKQVAGRY